MNKDIRLYGNNFDLSVVKDVEKINDKLKEETSDEEILKLRLQRLYRGMEMNHGLNKRNVRGYFPY